MAFGEFVFIKRRNRHGYMLFFTTSIGETEINKFNVVFFYHFHYVGDCHLVLLSAVGWKNMSCFTSIKHAIRKSWISILTQLIRKENIIQRTNKVLSIKHAHLNGAFSLALMQGLANVAIL